MPTRILHQADVLAAVNEADAVGFFGATPHAKPVVTGSRTGELAAATSLRAALVALGLITDTTTA